MQARILQFRFLGLGLFLLFSAAALAQDTATLTGTIRDNTGAVIPNAAVTLKNTATGIVRELKTNSAGEYVIAAMPPGQYNLTVSVAGFRNYQADGVILRVAQNARIDVTMQVGNTSEQVTVHGEGLAQVNTQSSELGGTITGKEVTQLQLNGRNFTQLITLVPGVSNQTGQDEGVVGAEGSISYSVNGGRTEYNNWEVDGGDMMDNGSNFSLNVYPSVEAIEEVQVLTSNYGAQYGKNGSGTVEVETKSGTNQFHGSLWEFARNEAFNAHNYFDVPGTPKAGYKKHDFGYSVGGPIWKNHTFFFWLQNWRRENVPYNFYNFVPSMENRQGNFNDVCSDPDPTDCPFDPNTGDPFPQQPAAVDRSEWQSLLDMIPEPNFGSGANSIFAAAIGQPTHWREDLIRVDHDFNSKVAAHVPGDSRFLGHHESHGHLGRRELSDDRHALHRAGSRNGRPADRDGYRPPCSTSSWPATRRTTSSRSTPTPRSGRVPAASPCPACSRTSAESFRAFVSLLRGLRWWVLRGPNGVPLGKFESDLHLPRQRHQESGQTQAGVRRLLHECREK